jgi:tRNA (guanine37-N1)-methyltransferase
MIFDVITIFPGFFRSSLEFGALKRALASGAVEIRLHDLRDFADGPHRTVDDRPFGGGPGMVFKPEPIFRAVDAIKAESGDRIPTILLSPQGRLLRQQVVEELVKASTAPRGPSPGSGRMVLICGRYEGVDDRVAQSLASDEVSIGDYVLSGGELAAAVVMECCTRLLPGVMGNEASGEDESFSRSSSAPVGLIEAGAGRGDFENRPAPDVPGRTAGLLGFPQYTRPVEFRGLRVPEILLSGNHAEIRRWRRRQALERTWLRRPELLGEAVLSGEEREILDQLKRASGRIGL